MRARRPRLTLVSGCSARPETVTISGWQTNLKEARRFEFTTEERSSGYRPRQDLSNLGVISAVYYRERVSTITPGTSSDYAGRQAPAPPLSAPVEQEAREGAAGTRRPKPGPSSRLRRRPTMVRRDWHGPPDRPRHRAGVAGPGKSNAQTVNIRYEFHPQLVRLGILPLGPTADPLLRREGAHGFAPGFCPEPPRQR